MSEIKVNKISPRSGTAFTLGDSGDTFTIPSGATINNQGTAVNFGATGSASWVTTVKTSTFTAVAGEGYFVNTTSGAVTVNLPAGVAGAVVAVKDYANTFDTNNLTLASNGSDKIGGSTNDSIVAAEGIAITLVFIDSTRGWLVTDSGLQSEAPEPEYIVATGGTITTVCTNFKVHTFTGPSTFTVCSVGNSGGSNTVDYLVVAGGGGGNRCNAGIPGGAGGAGGYRESPGTASGSYTVSPLGTSPAVALPVTATGFPITVGGGSSAAGCGNSSAFSTITSAGGGKGGEGSNSGNAPVGTAGGSGGGGGSGAQLPESSAGGAGNTPPTNPAQGNAGGPAFSFQGHSFGSGGGGGATTAGAGGGPATGGNGGTGGTSSINGTPTQRAGGGGGSGRQPLGGTGNAGSATGGGGAGGTSSLTGSNATANTGGGGGGESSGTGAGTTGGSGIVIIRYKFQN